MRTAAALLDLHEHAHRSLSALLAHCAKLTDTDLVRPLAGFGYPTIREQLHHVIGAEQYWLGVLQGRVEVDEDSGAYPDVAAMCRLLGKPVGGLDYPLT